MTNNLSLNSCIKNELIVNFTLQKTEGLSDDGVWCSKLRSTFTSDFNFFI